MSQWLAFVLTLVPIAAILLMLMVWRKPADITGVVGWAVTALVAMVFFQTGTEVVLRSSVSGLISSFPVSLIVATSLLQITIMQKSGALKRIIIFLKTISNQNRAVSIMMINIGFGILMVSVGATPVSILPPILLAMGYSTYTAIALPAVGYDALCTYALLGAPIVVFTDIANKFFKDAGTVLSLSDVGSVFFLFLPIVSTMIGFAMLWIVGKWEEVKKGWVPVLLTGLVISVVAYFTNKVDNLVPLTGVVCGAAVILAMVLYLKMTGQKVFDRSKLTEEEKAYEKEMPLWRAFMPWVLLTVIIIGLNIPPESFNYLYRTLLLPISGVNADGSPIVTRALWNAYTWIFVSTLLSLPFLKMKKGMLNDSLKTWVKRAMRPTFAASIFFAIGTVMQTAGYDMATQTFQVDSMVKTLANVSADALQGAYRYIAAFIGLLGGFITGSEASTVGMFGTYVLTSAQKLGFGTKEIVFIAAVLAFGGGLASIISPAKLQNAAASIDRIGEEQQVIRTAFVFALLFTGVVAVFTGFVLATGLGI